MALVACPPVPPIATNTIHESSTVWKSWHISYIPNYSIRPKSPNAEAGLVLWHQDAGYTQAHDPDTPDGQLVQMRMINCWAPIVPARPENGCMQFVPGTHTLGVVPHETGEFYLEIAEAHLKPHLTDAVDVDLYKSLGIGLQRDDADSTS